MLKLNISAQNKLKSNTFIIQILNSPFSVERGSLKRLVEIVSTK